MRLRRRNERGTVCYFTEPPAVWMKIDGKPTKLFFNDCCARMTFEPHPFPCPFKDSEEFEDAGTRAVIVP